MNLLRSWAAKALFFLGDLVYRIELPGQKGAVMIYTTYNTLMLWSIDVQGENDGPWERIEEASELSQSQD